MKNLFNFKAILASSIMLLLLLIPKPAVAQYPVKFNLFGPDAENFPTVRAFYQAQIQYKTDSSEDIPSNLISASNFTVKDNGIPIQPALITHKCSTIVDGPAVSVVLVIDKSGSMGEYINPPTDTSTRFDIVKRAAKAFVQTIKFVPPTTVAVVSFDAISYLEQYFTNDKGLLYKAIDSISLGGDTRYNLPLLDSTKGAIPMLSTRPPHPVKRVIIFLTDGQPNKLDSVRRDSIIRGLKGTNVLFFAITVQTEMNDKLAEFSDVSGGASFSVTSGNIEAQLIAIYKQIANRLQSRNVCYLEWPAPLGCTEASRDRTVSVTFSPPNGNWKLDKQTDSQRPLAPENSVLKITMEPPIMSFGNPQVGQANEVIKQLTITSNYDLTIATAPTITYSGGIFKFVNWNPPEDFKANVPRIFKVSFVQTDVQAYRQGTIIFKGDPCDPPTVTLLGGVTNVTLTSPGQGIIYSSCQDINITWDGVPASQDILLQYSTDDGVTWNLITQKANGNKFVWLSSEIQKLPDGTKYRIRASLPAQKTYVWAKGSGGSLNDTSTSVAVSQNGLDVFTCGGAQGSVDFGSGISFNTAASSLDAYVTRYDATGNLLWAKNFSGANNEDIAVGVAAGENGECYVTGYFIGDAIFGGSQKTPFDKTKRNFFMVTVANNGQLANVYDFGPRKDYSGEAYGDRIAYDPSEKVVYAIGKFKGKLFITSAQSLNGSDPNKWYDFTAKFSQTGTFLGAEIGTPYLNKKYSADTAIDANGCKYETGTYSGTLTKGNTITSHGLKDGYLAKFCGLPASSDSTHAAFTIAKAQLWSRQQIGATYTLNEASVKGSSSTVIPFRLFNKGGLSTEITDVIFEDPTQFSLTNDLVGRQFPADTNAPEAGVEIAFAPLSEGYKCSKVTFKAKCSPDVTITVCGNAIEPCSYEMTPKVTCQRTLISTSSSNTFNAVLTNKSNFILKGTLSIIAAPPSEFTIITINGNPPTDNKFTLNPNLSLNVEIKFTPTASGIRTASLNYGLPATCVLQETQIEGEGFESLNLSVDPGFWSCVRVNSPDTKFIKVNNIGAMDATVTAITTQTGTHFSIAGPAPSFTIPAGQSRDVEVVYTPLTEGNHSDSLFVTATGSTTITKGNALIGEGCLPHIVLDKKCFPLTAIGTIATKPDAITITNTGKMTLDISAINIISNPTDFFGVVPLKSSIPIGDSKDIEMKFNPSYSGTRTSKVEIVSNAVPGRDTIEICGDAFAPDTTIDFGTRYLCENPTATVIYENTGSTALDIAVSMAGANPGEFTVEPNGAAVTIPRASSRPFTITFKPTATGDFNAIAKLGPRNVNVKGKGITANLDFATNPKKLIDAVPGKTVSLTVQSSLTEDMGTLTIDTITVKFTVNPQLFAFKQVTNLLSGSSSWVWGPKISPDSKEITITGTPLNTGIIPKGNNIALFRLDLEYFLGSVDTASIPMSVSLSPDRSACLFITATGSDEIRLDNICFRNGRLLQAGKTAYSLSAAQPSPARDQVTIHYGVGFDSRAKLELYNSLGERIETLVDKFHTGGDYEMTLDVSSLPAGMYFYSISTGLYKEQRQLIIAR